MTVGITLREYTLDKEKRTKTFLGEIENKTRRTNII